VLDRSNVARVLFLERENDGAGNNDNQSISELFLDKFLSIVVHLPPETGVVRWGWVMAVRPGRWERWKKCEVSQGSAEVVWDSISTTISMFSGLFTRKRFAIVKFFRSMWVFRFKSSFLNEESAVFWSVALWVYSRWRVRVGVLLFIAKSSPRASCVRVETRVCWSIG
jgi:hypothetical protein